MFPTEKLHLDMLNALQLFGQVLFFSHVHAQVREGTGANNLHDFAWVAELEKLGAARIKQWGIDMRQRAVVRDWAFVMYRIHRSLTGMHLGNIDDVLRPI